MAEDTAGEPFSFSGTDVGISLAISDGRDNFHSAAVPDHLAFIEKLQGESIICTLKITIGKSYPE